MYKIKLLLMASFLLVGLISASADNISNHFTTIAPALPPTAFSPSNTRTVDNQLMDINNFYSAERCQKCHPDAYAAWSQSLHRNAAREPFYRESADILLKTRGIEFTRHCESCHTPVALLTGTLTKTSGKTAAPFTPLDHEGVTCVICHSIVEARPDGTASYTIRRPALLMAEDGTLTTGNVSDEQIMADKPSHKRAMMRPLMKQPEFCSVCHKVIAPTSLNGYKNIPGFSAFDEWQQSAASKESVLPFYPKDERKDCRSCHMPKVPSTQDYGAKDGFIALHRWPGANTAAPLFYGQTEQVDVIKKFLQSNVLVVDILALKHSNDNKLLPLVNGQTNSVTLTPGEQLQAEVVVSNRNAAHSFPPEVRDLYEAWLNFEVLDAQGETIFQSGYLKPDGKLDGSAHVYKAIILDGNGKTITRHQIWLTTIKAYDNAIQAGRSDTIHYQFTVPQAFAGQLTLKATVRYRRFNQEYTDYVLGRQHKDLAVPIIQMATTQVQLTTNNSKALKPLEQLPTLMAKRWNDYGIGLLEQANYGAAAQAFSQAVAFDPQASYLTNVAIAELRTERFAPQTSQLAKAEALLDQALTLEPQNMRAKFYRALVWRGLGRLQAAATEMQAVAGQYPKDREVARQLGQTLYSLGNLPGAQQALETLLAIDPNDAGAYRLLAPIYESQGFKAQAAKTTELYLQFRDDPRAEGVAASFFAAHPEWREERTNQHVHLSQTTLRPVLTGQQAAPID